MLGIIKSVFCITIVLFILRQKVLPHIVFYMEEFLHDDFETTLMRTKLGKWLSNRKLHRKEVNIVFSLIRQ